MKPLARVTITIPESLIRAADARARAQGRSRSWVIADAVRRALAGEAATHPAAGSAELPAAPRASVPHPVGMVREPAAEAWGGVAVALTDARRRQLESDLRLTPAERLAHAQELARLADLAHPRPRRRQVIAFGTLDDFAAWKAARRIGA